MSGFNQYDVDLFINPITNEVFASWTDERNGNADIYVSEFDEYGSLSYIPNVPITVIGTKQIGNDPIIYEHDEEYITDSSGTVDITLEWDTGYTVGLKTASTTYNIVFTNIVQPFELLPGGNKEILLYLKP